MRPRKKAEVRLDCRGLLCPLPVLEAGRALRKLEPPFTLVVLSDDPAAPRDFEAFANARGLHLESAPPEFRLQSKRRKN